MHAIDSGKVNAHTASRRALLRAETAEAHAELDAFVAARHFLASQSGYAAFLRAQARFHDEVERACGVYGPQLLADWPARAKAHLACADLRDLGAEIAQPVAMEGTLEARSAPRALGLLYVAEGSTLGGLLLAGRVRADLGYDGARGARFLNAYGDRHGVMWRDFLNALETAPLVRGEERQLVDGAHAAFARARALLETEVG